MHASMPALVFLNPVFFGWPTAARKIESSSLQFGLAQFAQPVRFEEMAGGLGTKHRGCEARVPKHGLSHLSIKVAASLALLLDDRINRSVPITTAFCQQALACAATLAQAPARPRDLKPTTPDAPAILLSNVCGSFVRIEHQIYTLSELER